MKKLITVIAIALSLCSCKMKIAPQNPDVKLSDEHAKMFNMIVNLSRLNADWNINFDTSSDNYLCSISYSNFDEKIVSYVLIDHFQYCNGVISDYCSYKYENEKTCYYVPEHYRWSDNRIIIYGGSFSYSYSLQDPAALTTNEKHALANEIRKIDDETYLYRRYARTPVNQMFATSFGGDNYITFEELKKENGYYTDFEKMTVWTKNMEVPRKVYLNGFFKQDFQYGKAYIFTNKDQTEGFYCYQSEEEGTKVEKKRPVKRRYDDSGRLIYEEEYFDNGKVQVKMLTKKLPDITEISSNLKVPIDLENAVEYEL